jgi:hypothetical protein
MSNVLDEAFVPGETCIIPEGYHSSSDGEEVAVIPSGIYITPEGSLDTPAGAIVQGETPT